MIHLEHHGPVLAIRMARSLFGRPLYWTAAYWVDGLLIDTGPRCTANEFLRAMEKLHVERVVVTHSHEDIIGGLAKLRMRYPHVEMYASHRALPLIQSAEQLDIPLYRRLVWGMPQPVDAVRSLDETENVIKTPNYTFRVIDTPGHSRDHISLFEPTQRWVFCGDSYNAATDPIWARDEDLFGVISSLRTLASLRPERVFPGNGRVGRTPLPDIHGKISWLTRLTRDVAVLDGEGLSVSEMVTSLFRGESPMRYWTAGHHSASNLIKACQSYNALIAPVVADSPLGGEQLARSAKEDSADSSASQSADLGDIVR